MTRTPLALALFLLLAVPAPRPAEGAVSCHCFRDRAYDPARPAGADPYVLANAQNSLLAAAYGIAKKQVVRAKMTGADGDDLWVAHAVAASTGRTPEELLSARAGAGSWPDALSLLGVAPGRLDPALARALAPGAPAQAPANAAVDAVLVQRLGVSQEKVTALRRQRPSNAEAVTAAVLHRLGRGDPAEILQRVRAGQATWGALFHDAGVAPAEIEGRVRGLLGP